MRKLFALILACCLLLALAACSGGGTTQVSADRVLVAYFSATGNTARVAENIAGLVGADLYEIVPQEPYTAEELASDGVSGRLVDEQTDAAARPAIQGQVENMDGYDVVFIGYPIWWGDAPRIIQTFLESYDFSGKTIIPFCTSASVDVGHSASDLHSSAGGSPKWLDGTRFSSSAARQTVVDWMGGLPIEFTE